MRKINLLVMLTMFLAVSNSYSQVSKEEMEHFFGKYDPSDFELVFIERGSLGVKNPSNNNVKFHKNQVDLNPKTAKFILGETSVEVTDGIVHILIPYSSISCAKVQEGTEKYYSSVSIELMD
ncbi:hypothetical protein [Flagellimonas sp.]|uniref:hypothetical protein n=1 Tax=Flagellimonas sp. TaxID=2058762 RepID=UPI003BAE3C2C